MKYFKLIHSGIDVTPMYTEIVNNEDAWNCTGIKREQRMRVQQETNSIHIRTFVQHPDLSVRMVDNQESRWTDLSKKFPLACKFMKDFARSVDGTLSRAHIVRLKPKGIIYRHIDEGAYYLIRDRYHLVIKSSNGSHLFSGHEKVRMKEGELWWFDNWEHHQAKNPSDDWRIHYIFDVLPNCYKKLAKNARPLHELPQWYINVPPAPEEVKT